MGSAPFSTEHIVTFLIYAPILSFAGARICGSDHDSFERNSIIFISLPMLAGVALTFGANHMAGMIACGLTTLAVTTFIGNLSLKSCLILSVTSPIILFIAASLGQKVENLISRF